MARATPALLSAALLLAVLASPAALASPATTYDDGSSVCDFVTDPELCEALYSKSGSKSLEDLTLASIKETMSTADNARSAVANIMGEPIIDERLKHNLGVCGEAFAHAVDSLKTASQEHDAGARTAMVSAVSDAVNHVGVCNDIFSESPGLVSPVADVTNVLKKLVSNSLALSVAYELQSRNQKLQ